MDTTDLVSIIIPVYNPGKYFIRCIESCIHQTYSNLEIVLVDDCSTDPYTIELMNEYAAKDPRIRILKSPQNSGQAYCRNMGIEACRGKYFALIDNDDSFAVRFIERAHEAIVKYDTDLVLTDICVYPDETVPESRAKHLNRSLFDLPFKKNAVMDFDFVNKNGLHFQFPLTVYSKLFNTERYIKSGLQFDPAPELRSVEDEMWCSRLEFALKNFYFMPFVGVFRCIRKGSDGSNDLVYCQRSLRSLEKRYKFLCEKGLEKEYGSRYLTHVLQRIAAIVCAWDSFDDRRRQLIEGLDLLKRLINRSIKRYPARYIYFNGYNWNSFYDALYNNQRRTTLWWFALPTLHDDTDDDMQLLRRWLDGMVDAGFRVEAISSSIHKHEEGLSMLLDVMSQMHEHARTRNRKFSKEKKSLLIKFADNTYDCLLVNIIAKNVDEITEFDHRLLEQTLTKALLKKDYPDVMLVSGSDPCSLKLFAILKQLGLKLIYVATGKEDGFLEGAPAPSKIYSSREELGGEFTSPATTAEVMDMFEHIITFSPNIAKEWEARFKQPIKCLGYLARTTFQEELSSEAQYVTINSNAPEHGIAVFMKVALSMSQTDPNVHFLITTDSNIPMQKLIEQLHFPDGTLITDAIRGNTSLSISSHPINFDHNYDKSLVMLLPELQEDYPAEIIANSLVNGVPVITTDKVEKVEFKDSVTYLSAPATTLADPYCLPTDEEVAPYIEAVKAVLSKDPVENRKAALKAYDLEAARKAWRDLLLPYGKDPEDKDE